jgi:nucleoside 2-deoxyribosyltransferase
MNIYLAGPMTIHYDDSIRNHAQRFSKYHENVIKWRDDVENYLKEDVRDNNIKIINPANGSYSCFESCNISKMIITKNMLDLKRTDLIIVDINHIKKSPGTIFELTYAFLNQIPVLAFGDDIDEVGPHIRHCITHHQLLLQDILYQIDYYLVEDDN